MTFTATVSGSLGTPTGSVSFVIDGGSPTTTPLTAGQAALTTSALAAGPHAVSVSYGGDSAYADGSTDALTQRVRRPTTTALMSSPNPSTAGQSVTFTATVTASGATPTGSVSFVIDGSPSSAPLNGSGQATLSISSLSAGTHSVVASYGPTADFGASSSAPLTQTVNAAPVSNKASVTLSVAQSSVDPGQPHRFTVRVTPPEGGATPEGTVTLDEGGTSRGTITLSGGTGTATVTFPSGPHSIKGIYNPSAVYVSSNSNTLRVVTRFSTTTAVTSDTPNPSDRGQTVRLVAQVTASGGGVPTGRVQFFSNGSALGVVTLDGTGKATLDTTKLSIPGTSSITATYQGSTDHATSTSPATSHRVRQTTATVVKASSTSVPAGSSVTFTATVKGSSTTPTGTVQFFDGASMIGTGTLDATGKATLATSSLSAGSHSITAKYVGASDHSTSTSAAITVTVA